jgi:hypothetical protein
MIAGPAGGDNGPVAVADVTSAAPGSGDNSSLSTTRRRRRRRDREAPDVGEAVRRLVAALGRRAAEGDLDALVELERVADAIREAEAVAVDGLRRVGYSDGEVGRELGVSRQAVRQRWPRASDISGGDAG